MNWTRIFVADDRLRPIWRFFLSVILLFAAYVVAGEATGQAFRGLRVHPNPLAGFFWVSVVALLAILAAFKLLTTVFDQRPLGSVGLAFHGRWGVELGHGLVLGAVMIFATVALEGAGGGVHFSYAPHPMWRGGSITLVLFAVAAVNEEATFRGYPFQRLVESITPGGAIAVSSALFGLMHLGNPHHTWISTTNTMLVGVPLAIAYLRTRSLWMPIGMHFIWNFLTGFLMGLPVSGITFPASILQAQIHGAVWLTGAEYGPEGGLMATIIILLATLYVTLSKRIYTSEEMNALVSGPPPLPKTDQPVRIFPAASEDESSRAGLP
jgi:hypothetical protein